MIERVQAEMREAMRDGRRPRLEALRMMLSALQRAAGERPRGEFGPEADIPIIEEFLPAALGEDELARAVDQAVADTGAAGMRDMGRVMGRVRELTGGRADGAAAAALVRSRLGQGGG